MKYLFLFGRTPLLSRGELLRLIGVGLLEATVVRELEDGIVIEAESISGELFERLGGTVRVVGLDPKIREAPKEFSGKFSFGFSYYHVPQWRERRRKENVAYKKLLLANGVGARFVDATEPELPTAAVIGNRLIDKGAEFIVYRLGSEEMLGKTLFIQDIDAYTARDQARPARDAKIGMLPLKLAQTMINLAVGAQTRAVWDPMVGTGVVMQEALLSDYTAYGSDNSEKMVSASEQNIAWLRNNHASLPESSIFAHDITDGWPDRLATIDVIVTEGYLGEPRHHLPTPSEIDQLSAELSELYKNFFLQAAEHLKKGARIVICFPYFEGEKTYRVNFVDELASDKYTLHGIYDYRPHEQIVGRQITIFEKV